MLSALSVPRAFAQWLAGRETCRLLGARQRSFTSTSRNPWAAVVLVSSHKSSGVWVRARPDVDPRRDSGHSPSSPCSAWCFVPGGAHPTEEPQRQSPTRTLLWSKDELALRSLPGSSPQAAWRKLKQSLLEKLEILKKQFWRTFVSECLRMYLIIYILMCVSLI